MSSLNGKVAIITGGARGMGAATSRVFAEAGYRVVIADLLEKEGQALAGELGEAVVYQRHDVSAEASWSALVGATLARWGRIDALVNNAGVLLFKALLDTTPTEFERVLRINVMGSFLGIRAMAPHMIERGNGTIVNISSVDGMRGANGLAAYASSKWALRGLTRTAALELGHRGVRVNSVHPGGVDTVMGNPGGLQRADVNHNFENIPLQRIGDPREVAKVSLFLSGDESAYVCGAEFVVDGGMLSGQYYPGMPGAPGV